MRIENVFRQLEDLAKKNNRKRLLRRGIALLSAVVLLFTVNTLKRNAVAMQPKPTCGYDYDHSHTEACFDENGMAICGLHEHTDDCFQNPDEEAAPEELEVELGDVTEDGTEDLAPEAIDADAAADMMGTDRGMMRAFFALLEDHLETLNFVTGFSRLVKGIKLERKIIWWQLKILE